MPRRQHPVVVVFALLALATVPAAAQVRVADGVSVRLSGRVHTQLNTTSVAGASSTEFLVRRARVSATVTVSDLVSGKVEPDFGKGKVTLMDAYLRLSFDPRFRLTLGQFKRPFDLFELTSSSQILVVERAGGVRGIYACTGPGGVCTLSRLTEKLQYAGRDIGVLADGRLAGGRVSYAVSVTNGTGANAEDENGNKSFTGRLTVEVAPNVTVSGNVGAHDYVHPTSGTNRYATALGGDVEIGSFSQGLHVQAGAIAGENWRVPVGTENAANFLTAQGILSYRVPVAHPYITGVEPVFRVSWGDPDTDTDGDQGFLFTPGLMLHFGGRNKIAVNADIWSPNSGDTEFSIKAQSFFYF